MVRKYALVSTGPMSGKSTLAKHLEREYGFVRADHSRSLVLEFVKVWNDPLPYSEHISVEQVYAEKEQWRPMLQEFGYRIGYNDSLQARYWTEYTLREWLTDTSRNVVFDSFRGELQASVMRDLGFTLVQLELDDETRCSRAEALGKKCNALLLAMNAHPEIERGIKHPDIVLDASQPVEVLGKLLMQTPEPQGRGGSTHGLRIFGATFN